MHRITLAKLGSAIALGLFLAAAALADDVLDRARRLLQQKDAKGAYQLLQPLAPQRAGEVEYDYLLGIAALDAGDAQQAVFALERVLAVNPNFLQARAEIARAYFVLGERENARREFRTVRGQDPPEEARSAIDRYLSVLEPQRTQLRGFVELTYGYDSNVNSATQRSQIAIPFLAGAIVTLDPFTVERSDDFFGVNTGASVSHMLNDEWSLLANAGYNGKVNLEEDRFDTGALDGSAGVRWARGANAVVAATQGQRFRVDNRPYRDSLGGTVQWIHNLNQTQQITVFGQYANLKYPDQRVRDARRWIGGLAYAQALALKYAPVFYVSAYGGEEKERDAAFPSVGHQPLGLRVGGQLAMAGSTYAFASASYEHRRYNGTDPTFLAVRKDDQIDYRLGLTWSFAKDWSLTPQVQHTRNQSNIELNEYDRTLASVSVRRDF
jgi:tetratricopeptide (TPR) repeat protein